MTRLCVILALVAALAIALSPGRASAHKPSDSYLSLSIDGQQVTGQWDIALRDLDYAIGLDSDNDGVITWGELRARQRAIASYALSHLALEADHQRCTLRATGHLLDDHSDGAYEVLRFAADCPAAPRNLSVAYSLLFDLDPQHRGLLRVEDQGRTQTAVLSPAQNTWTLDDSSFGRWRAVVDYLREGVWHIWTGFDHMLFLSALLLPAVLQRRSGRWTAVATFREAFGDVVRVVTAFTLAHSITLSLAVLGWIEIPSRVVESAIAASVVAAALNNLYPIFHRRLWLVAFGFGLVHGLGFANVLAELGLPANALLLSLASFNIGVEAGQLAIVAAFLPAAFLLRRHWLYPRVVLGLGSCCIVAVAGVWLVERSLAVRIFS
jgi:HupE / UreJ protein